MANDPSQLIHSGGSFSVARDGNGPIAALRLTGMCTPEVAVWLPEGVRDAGPHVTLHLRELMNIDDDLLDALAETVRQARERGQQIALIDPPHMVIQGLRRVPMPNRPPVLSTGMGLDGFATIWDAWTSDKHALRLIGAEAQANPIWRRLDYSRSWQCPVCGSIREEIKFPKDGPPSDATLIQIRAHLLQRCPERSERWPPCLKTEDELQPAIDESNRRRVAADSARIHRMQERMEEMRQMEESLGDAGRRMRQLLPVEPQPDDAADIAVCYRPLESLGGDFLDFYDLPDNRFGFAIGDVSGHGAAAGIVMGMARMSFRIRAVGFGTIRQLMIYANADLFEILKRTAYLTAFVARIDRMSMKLTCIRAGHPPPLLRRAATGEIEELNPPGTAFGTDDGKIFNTLIQEMEVQIEPGDVLVYYTDGVTEACEPDDYGPERFKQSLAGAPVDGSAADVLAAITAPFDAFLDGRSPGDDVTIVVLKFR